MIRRLFFELRYLFKRVPWDTGESPPELIEFLANNPPGRAIDLGCGTGTNAITMAQHGWQATGVDFSRQAIERARKKAARAGVEVVFILGSVTTLEGVEGQFDLGVDIGCYHSLTAQQRDAYVARLEQVIQPGGTLLLYAFIHPEGEPDSSWPSEAEVGMHFSQAFEIMGVAHGFNRDRPSAWFTIHRKA